MRKTRRHARALPQMPGSLRAVCEPMCRARGRTCGMKVFHLSYFPVLLWGCGALLLGGCSSPAWKRAEQATGLFDFVSGSSDEAGIPVRTDAGNRCIVRAQVRTGGGQSYVTGFVERVSVIDPPMGSHVDISVIDQRGRTVEAVADNYLPREIPHGRRGAAPRSHFTTRLRALPPAGATVRVSFHGESRAVCQLKNPAAPES